MSVQQWVIVAYLTLGLALFVSRIGKTRTLTAGQGAQGVIEYAIIIALVATL